jgi:hypothetical protein
MGTLNIIDLTSREIQPLFETGDVKSLVWKPDGGSLGMIARLDPGSYEDNVVVFDLSKDKVTYSAPVDFQSNAYQDWPIIHWGVDFPVEMGDMDACARPPEGK